VVRKRGVPLALYSDRHMIFQSGAKEPLTLEEELAGKPLPTQVGRVLDELGITWIGARSPARPLRVQTCAPRHRAVQPARSHPRHALS